MITSDQYIPCPVCQTRIPFSPLKLIQGTKFGCPTCSASIGLSTQSKELVKDTMDKFQELKKKSLSQQ